MDRMTSKISKRPSGTSIEKSPEGDKLAALAASMKRTASRKCGSCAEPYRSVISRWLDLMAKHPLRPGAKIEQLRAHLHAEHGYILSTSSLQDHCARHDGARYAAAKAQ
jgi:hypothetical protein